MAKVMWWRHMGAVGLLALAPGCGAHTGVVPIGQDTFMVSRQGWISTQSVGELKSQAFAEANAFCTSQGKSILPIYTRDTSGVLRRSYPEAEVQFRCLSPDDPELRRPTLQKAPDVLIERRD
jgi:hypothetical protein